MVGVLAVGLVLPSFAGAELGDPDLAEVVYSNQFGFDATGAPVIRVGLADGLTRTRFSATGPVLFQPGGPSGPSVELPAGTWTVTVDGGRPARLDTWLSVERVEPPDPAGVAAAVALWRTRGFPRARSLDRGAVFGFSGEVMDSRYAVVAVAGTTDPEEAAQTAARIEADFGVVPVLQHTMVRLPDGEIRIRGADQSVTLRNRRVLRIAPGSPSTRFKLRQIVRATPGLGAGETDPTGRTYRGAVYFAVDRAGRLAVGNELGAEALLSGLVGAETFVSAPHAALRAQAVTARNEVLSKVGKRHLTDPFLLCDDVHCQVYPGSAREARRTTEAVKATRGEMLFSGGNLVDAFYSASCGGSSEANDAVWPVPAHPSLAHRFDAPPGHAPAEPPGSSGDAVQRFLASPPAGTYCQASSYAGRSFRWRRRLTARRLEALVGRRYAVGPVQDVRILARGPGGRVTELVVEGANDQVTVRGELTIRRLFGGLKSALFVLEPERDAAGALKALSFSGGGFGHGVGMCQIGAIGRAEAGQDYREILRHYYGGAEVRRIY